MALANCMDLVLCSTNARFMYPFSTLGITPEMGSSMLMPYLVGMAKAKEMMMLGRWFSAVDAVALGLANDVVAPDVLMPRAVAVAEELAGKQQAALSLAKRVMNHHLRQGLEEVLLLEAATIQEASQLTGGPVGLPRKPSKL
jgi:enoyl-CoA hydratase/carnithine racemase